MFNGFIDVGRILTFSYHGNGVLLFYSGMFSQGKNISKSSLAVFLKSIARAVLRHTQRKLTENFLVCKAEDSTTTRSCHSHNQTTPKILYSKLPKRLECFFAPRCFGSRISIKSFFIISCTMHTSQYNNIAQRFNLNRSLSSTCNYCTT